MVIWRMSVHALFLFCIFIHTYLNCWCFFFTFPFIILIIFIFQKRVNIAIKLYVNDIYVLKNRLINIVETPRGLDRVYNEHIWKMKCIVLYFLVSQIIQDNIQLVIIITSKHLLCFYCCTLTELCLSCLCRNYHSVTKKFWNANKFRMEEPWIFFFFFLNVIS